MNETDRLRGVYPAPSLLWCGAPARRSGAAEFPPHQPSAAPELGLRKNFSTGIYRLELAIAFLKDANQAEKYDQQESRLSREAGRDFLKKIGSNFRIADRTLVLDFKNAFKIAEKYHAEALCAEASNLDFSKCDSWR